MTSEQDTPKINNNNDSTNNPSGSGETAKKKRGRPPKNKPTGVGFENTKKTRTTKNKKTGDAKKATTAKPVKQRKKKQYRLSSKAIFMTYPQCDLPLIQVKDNLTTKLNKYGIVDFIFAREVHEDNKLHVHGLIKTKKKIDTKNPAILHLDYCSYTKPDETDKNRRIIEEYPELPGSEGKPYYRIEIKGNYQGAKKISETLDYLTKEIYDARDCEEKVIMSPGMSKLFGEKYQYIDLHTRMIQLGEKGKIKEAMDLLKMEDPEEYLTNGEKIEKRLIDTEMIKSGFEKVYDLGQYALPDIVKLQLQLFEESIATGSPKALIIKGPSGCGKTQFVLSYLKNRGYFTFMANGVEDLKRFDKQKYSAILFDDANFSEQTREGIIHLVDPLNRSLKARYTDPQLPAGIPKVFTTNVDPIRINEFFGVDAAVRRIIVVQLPKGIKLYDENRAPTSEEDAKRMDFEKRFASYKQYEKEQSEKNRYDPNYRYD